MTKEQIENHKGYTKLLIEVMQAYIDGAQIQQRPYPEYPYVPELWKDVECPTWDWEHFDYQVKE